MTSNKPIRYTLVDFMPGDLKLGYHGETVDFVHRAYVERNEEHRADYDRLVESILINGVRDPLIVYEGHVLIGMRRCEIARELQPTVALRCAVVEEDVARWGRDDVLVRLEALKEEVGRCLY